MSLDLLRDPVASTRDTMKFRFKTSYQNGVLLYSRGTQGDYFALQLIENRMVLNIDLGEWLLTIRDVNLLMNAKFSSVGSGVMTSLSVGSLLDDNIWHDVVISRNRRDIIFSVDRVMTQGKIKGEFTRLNLNREVHSFTRRFV